MLLNNISISERNNRPAVLEKVGLQAFFLLDGQYADPYQISAVTIFARSDNLYPSSLLVNSTQLIDTTNVSGQILMNFCNSSADTSNVAFNVSNYTGGQSASGIFRTGVGKYIVILDGTINLSGVINLDGLNQRIANDAQVTKDYNDIWTLRMAQGSELQVVINEFKLRKGGFTVITEPLMLKAKTRLINSKVTLGSKVDLKLATNIVVENMGIDESVKNLLRDNVITGGSIEIVKVNEAANLPAKVTVSSFADTSAYTSMSADNVMIFTWNTETLSSHPQVTAGNFDSTRGVYAIRAKYNLFNEVLVTDPMYLTLT
jgi:hypothetical protein